MSRKATVALAVIIITAGLLRLVFATFVVGWGADTRGDEIDYHEIAVSLSAGEGFEVSGYPVTRRPPLYPVVLAAVYKAIGPHAFVGRIVQVLLGVLVVFLTFRVARRYFDETVALVAGGIAALNPFLIAMSGYLLTENLYVVLLLAALLVFPTPAHLNGPLRKVLLTAAVLAATALTRPAGLVLAVWMLGTGLLLGAGSLWGRTRNGLAAAALFCVILLPWCLRNYSVLGGWVGLTSHGGITFYQGNNQKVVDIPHYRGGVTPLAGLPHADEIARMGELERERFAWAKGKEFLRRNRGRVPQILWWKFARFWRLESDVGLSGVRSGWWWSTDSFFGRLASRVDVGLIYAIAAFPLSIAGVVLARRRWRELVFLYGVVIAHTAVALVFFGSIRGRIPVEPVVAIFAAVAVRRLDLRLRSRHQS
jgi:4-amino-4-deoxy-L-arabinose transferase-like glycosyltransferase